MEKKVFTWHGATIELDGTTETDYTADEVFVFAYLLDTGSVSAF